MSLERLYWILKYHQPQQLYRRLARLVSTSIRAFLFSLRPCPEYELGNLKISVVTRRKLSGKSTERLKDGKLTLLNLEHEVGWPINWRNPAHSSLPPLWRFHFHYHDYLVNLAHADAPLSWEVICHWIALHPSPAGGNFHLGWHPYVISKRIGTWTELWYAHPPSPDQQETVANSLMRQVQWLCDNLEREIGGNHLWENAKALIQAGCFFSGAAAEKWKRVGMELLDDCIQKQLLPWGEHYERCPSYQFDLAQGLLVIQETLLAMKEPKARFYGETAQTMISFLTKIAHPDLTLPLFGDSVAVTVEQCGNSLTNEWIGEYYVHRTGPLTVIFDAGQLAPDELPAHAHSDLLNFELSGYGNKLIVDSGTYSYTGNRRQAYKSTHAHNTLCVDGLELADCWSSFRMGRRGHVIDRHSASTSEGTWVLASHDAYRFLGIPAVTRIWFFQKMPQMVWSLFLLSKSSGERQISEAIHLHPDVSATLNDRTCVLNCGANSLILQPLSDMDLPQLNLSTYSPDFYVERTSQKIHLARTAPFSSQIASGWVLSAYDSTSTNAPTASLSGNTLTLGCKLSGRHWTTSLVIPRK